MITEYRKPRPEARQPGEYHEQLNAIAKWLTLPPYFRQHDFDGAWHVARWHSTVHYRVWHEGSA